MRRINAPFNNRRLIRFDIAVRTHLNPSGLWIAFNPLDPSCQCYGRTRLLHGPGRRLRKPPASERGAAPSAQESISLEPGKPVERELSGGQSHFYKITMTSGQYLQVIVSQKGIDALVALFTPDGKKIGEVDSEQATVRSETISAIAEATGAYRIEVRSAEKTAQTGRYEIKVEELREATAEDKYRVAAETLFREAEQLRQGTLEERRKGIEKYQEALELYRRAGDRRGEAAHSTTSAWSISHWERCRRRWRSSTRPCRSAGGR